MSDESTAVATEEEVVVEAPPQHDDAKSKPRRQPRYHVILWNDDDHTYEYVILMLGDLFGHPVQTAYKMAKEVDKKGRVIVLTTTLEHAELKRDQIHAYGKDDLVASCAGSMKSTIDAEC